MDVDVVALLGLPIAILSSRVGMVSEGLPVLTVIVAICPDIVWEQPARDVELVTE